METYDPTDFFSIFGEIDDVCLQVVESFVVPIHMKVPMMFVEIAKNVRMLGFSDPIWDGFFATSATHSLLRGSQSCV